MLKKLAFLKDKCNLEIIIINDRSNDSTQNILDEASENYSFIKSIKIDKEIYKKVQGILINDCVVIPAVDVKVSSVRKKNIKGFSSNPAYSTIFVYDLSKD